jgi:hypothetical protein
MPNMPVGVEWRGAARVSLKVFCLRLSFGQMYLENAGIHLRGFAISYS